MSDHPTVTVDQGGTMMRRLERLWHRWRYSHDPEPSPVKPHALGSIVSVRFTPEQHALLRQAANETNEPYTSLIRRLVLLAIELQMHKNPSTTSSGEFVVVDAILEAHS